MLFEESASTQPTSSTFRLTQNTFSLSSRTITTTKWSLVTFGNASSEPDHYFYNNGILHDCSTSERKIMSVKLNVKLITLSRVGWIDCYFFKQTMSMLSSNVYHLGSLAIHLWTDNSRRVWRPPTYGQTLTYLWNNWWIRAQNRQL